jgi:hypothetical protein
VVANDEIEGNGPAAELADASLQAPGPPDLAAGEVSPWIEHRAKNSSDCEQLAWIDPASEKWSLDATRMTP